MKKNILFVQSLLLLSLTVSPILGGKNKNSKYYQKQRQKNQYRKKVTADQPITAEQIQQQKQQHANLLEELFQSAIFNRQRLALNNHQTTNYHRIETNPYNNSTELISPLVPCEIETIDLPLPQQYIQNNDVQNTQDALFSSVILPVTEKELSFFEKLNYYTSTANQILQKVMYDLETGAFDVQYKTSFDILEEAIATATKNNDVKALATIASLCQQKYPTTIRISNNIAQPASEALKTHYSNELSLANDMLQKQHEEKIKQWNRETAACMTSILTAINSYQHNIKAIHESYDASLQQENERIKNLRKDVSTFSTLNREIRPSTAELLQNNQLKNPNNIHSTTMLTSEMRLGSIAKTIENVATINELQHSPKYMEELTNKCIAQK